MLNFLGAPLRLRKTALHEGGIFNLVGLQVRHLAFAPRKRGLLPYFFEMSGFDYRGGYLAYCSSSPEWCADFHPPLDIPRYRKAYADI
jgi:hypothetical protein